MKRRALFLFLLGGCLSAPAQTILLKNGDTFSAEGLVRKGDLVMTTVKSATGSTGQVGHNVTDIAQLNLPIPAEVTAAQADLARGNYPHALATVQPVLEYQKTIRDIRGNRWAETALVAVEALAELNRGPEATDLVHEISTYSTDPQILNAAKLQVALFTKFTDPAQALAAYDAILAESTNPATLSRLWIAEGDLRLAQHDLDEALMDYLTVTILYPDHNPLMPKALWGAAQSYAKLKDLPNAIKTYQALTRTFPDSPEAALAKEQLKKKAINP